MESPKEGLLAVKLDYEGGDSSQGISSRGAPNIKREWTMGTLKFLVELCEEKYWKYDRKPFKKANWESFAAQVNTQFPEEPQRTWHQTRDKWAKMKAKYLDEKAKQEQTGVPPSTWTPWYAIFDNIFGGTAKIKRVHEGVDQGVHVQHFETVVVRGEDEGNVHGTLPPVIAPSAIAGVGFSHSSHADSVNQPECEGVSKSARKRKWVAEDESIVSAINNFSKGILEIEKMKVKLIEKMIDNEKEDRAMLMNGQLQMTALIVEALKSISK